MGLDSDICSICGKGITEELVLDICEECQTKALRTYGVSDEEIQKYHQKRRMELQK